MPQTQHQKMYSKSTIKKNCSKDTIQCNMATYCSALQINTGLDATLLHCQLDSFVTSPQVSQVNRMIARQWVVRRTSCALLRVLPRPKGYRMRDIAVV